MRLLTAKEVSSALNISLARLYELNRLKVIPSVRLGQKQLRWNEDELIAWAKRGGSDANGANGSELRDGKEYR